MTDHRSGHDPSSPDEADLRSAYRAASALAGERAPRPDVRHAVLAEAQAIAAGQRTVASRPDRAANAPHWRKAAFASVFLMGFVGLLSWQVHREDDAAGGLASRPLASLPEKAPADPVPSAPTQPMVAEAPPSAEPEPQARARIAAPPPAPMRERLAQQQAPAPRADSATTNKKASDMAGIAPPSPPQPPAAQRRAHDGGRTQELAHAQAESGRDTGDRVAAAPAPSPHSTEESTVRQAETAAAAEATPTAPPTAPPATLAKSSRSASTFAGAGQAPSSPLHRAAGAGDLEALKSSLATGTPVNAPDASGSTPLALAVRGGHVEAVRALLAAGADPLRADRQGITPLHIARTSGSQAMQSLVEAAAPPR